MVGTSFVRAAEVWLAHPDGDGLILSSAALGDIGTPSTSPREKTVRRGEGVAGRAWERGRAVALVRRREGEGATFDEAAGRAGVAVSVGIPIIDKGRVTAVAVVHCGGPGEAAGAVEVWEPEHGREVLGLGSGYYGAHDGFRRMSALMKFPRGVGLPGRVWESGDPVVFDDLSTSGPFIRAAAAETYGFAAGYGMPVYGADGLSSVVVWLSVRGRPLLRRFESWVPGTGAACLTQSLPAGRHESGAVIPVGTRIEPGQGIVGKAWVTKLPCVPDESGDAPSKRSAHASVAIPIVEGDRVRSVVLIEG